MSFKEALTKIVGNENVSESEEILTDYSSDHSFVSRVRPRGVVSPATGEEIQAIVQWANETLTPLVPVSSGPPHFRGDTVPGVGGAVILDLQRMKSIIRIDPKNRVAMVEPGVTFGALQTELAKSGLSAYLPLCPRSTKSVVGSMLEREPITIPSQHWDSLDPFLCGEVIFGTGDKFRSGEAAGPDSIEEQWKIGKAQMVPFGPGQFDESRLISGAQGTMGIVTWATLKCRPLTDLKQAFLISSETIEPLLDLSYRLIRLRMGETCFIVNDLNMACLLLKSPEEIKTLRDALPGWFLVVSFEGVGALPKEKVDYQEADLREMVAQADNCKMAKTVGGFSTEEVAALLTAPSAEPYWKLRYKGACNDIFFLTTLDKTPGFIDAMPIQARSQRFSLEDLGVYIQPVVQGTSCHCEFNLFHDPADRAGLEGVKAMEIDGALILANKGAFFSRPYGAWAHIAYGRAPETMILQRKVKKIFDPNNILNPGRLCF
jgi:FAD/FMN-containing dehydrogenase